MTIGILPDDVLLVIFDFYVEEDPHEKCSKKCIEAWQSLVHVCRRWRSVVFGSPRRLNLEIVCTRETPVKDILDIWPALPLLIEDSPDGTNGTEGFDNIMAALEHNDRVHEIRLMYIPNSYLEKVLDKLQEPFPELTDLVLWCDETIPVNPHPLLGGGSAPPHLGGLELYGVSFPGLPKFLLSATHLHTLFLERIPDFGYIPPNVMVAALSRMTGLEVLCLKFQSPRSGLTSRCPPIHSVLPVLTCFLFKGASKYLEDLVAHVDIPRLNKLSITFFEQITFDTPQFIQFVSRTPRLKPLTKACVIFEDDTAWVNLSSPTSGNGGLNVQISYKELDWRLYSLDQVCLCTLCLPPLSMLEDLYIYQAPNWQPDWQGNIENPLWLELLHPFNAAKNLYLAKMFAPIVPALQEVLPTLQNIFLEGLQPLGPVQEGIGKFVAARQLSGHHLTVSLWERDSELPMRFFDVESDWE